MTLQEIIQAAQQLNVQEQIQLVSQLVQTLEQVIQKSIATTHLQPPTKPKNTEAASHSHLLKGKVKYYDAPYEPVAIEDWDALV
ncbi:hypothetical protein Lepto7375DRAFT_3419 [Leptolyngbya sp. PCC 7375]|nr:hypothetical protein Lepto7375DRAFT_3419 [Leptolyngbya sp. PCC 7375]